MFQASDPSAVGIQHRGCTKTSVVRLHEMNNYSIRYSCAVDVAIKSIHLVASELNECTAQESSECERVSLRWPKTNTWMTLPLLQ
jgi:hypothetical protein